ncbi:minor capsid protein [Sporosarcina sp. FA9]|uniref:minor capsid protein n=1 Tax=Sporosarcina sp. FA9 TaxID=3413030 RepID=UPI003F65F52C
MARVVVNIGPALNKLSPQALRRGQYALANQAMADMDQFVPMLATDLRNSATIDIDGGAINYNTPYAKAQFYGSRTTKDGKKIPFNNHTAPGTGPRWDLKAKSVFMSDWIDAFTIGADW